MTASRELNLQLQSGSFADEGKRYQAFRHTPASEARVVEAAGEEVVYNTLTGRPSEGRAHGRPSEDEAEMWDDASRLIFPNTCLTPTRLAPLKRPLVFVIRNEKNRNEHWIGLHVLAIESQMCHGDR